MIVIQSSFTNEALKYTLDTIFKDWLSVDYKLKIYNDTQFFTFNFNSDFSFQIKNSNWLFNHLLDVQPEFEMLSQNINNIQFEKIDVIAIIFHCLSRIEEYSAIKDEHDRFPFGNSLLHKVGLLNTPVVDIILKQLLIVIHQKFTIFLTLNSKYRVKVNTMDVDNAFQWKHRSGLKGIIFNILYRNKPDNFEQNIYTFLKQNKLLFWLCSYQQPFNNQVTLNHKKHSQFLNNISWQADIQIHPSYQAAESLEKLIEEKTWLEKRIGKKITKSRFHFFRNILPISYRNLIAAGILEDWSMGFIGINGYRAGTSLKYFWYDVELKQKSNLLIVPFTSVDLNNSIFKTNENESYGFCEVYHNFVNPRNNYT